MRLRYFLFLLFLFSGPQIGVAKPYTIVTTFSVLADYIEQVGGDKVSVKSIVGPNSDPHVYEPTPADAKCLGQADLIVVNGLGFEGWMDRLIRASGYKGDVVVATKGIKPRILETYPLFTFKSKAKKLIKITDPHAWHTPKNARLYTLNILEALKKLSPENANYFEKNAARFLAELDQVDHWILNKLADISPHERIIITAHDAFGYLGDEYHIKFLSPIGLSTDTEPSAKEIVALIQQMREHKVKVIFLENITNAKLMRQISEETGAKIGGTLYSDALSEKNGPAPTYIKMMYHNLKLLLKALKENEEKKL